MDAIERHFKTFYFIQLGFIFRNRFYSCTLTFIGLIVNIQLYKTCVSQFHSWNFTLVKMSNATTIQCLSCEVVIWWLCKGALLYINFYFEHYSDGFHTLVQVLLWWNVLSWLNISPEFLLIQLQNNLWTWEFETDIFLDSDFCFVINMFFWW